MRTSIKGFKIALSAGSLFAASFLGLGTAEALTATSNMEVSATVTANCTISAGALAFGAYDPVTANAATPLDGTATLTVSCTSGAATTITLGQGLNAGGGSTDAVPVRRMDDVAGATAGTSFLSYSLFQETGRTTAWGNDATSDVVYTGIGSTDSVTVYGRVAAGQNVAGGTYADTVVATITF